MFKKIFVYVERFILSSLIIYLYNCFFTSGGMLVKMNLFAIIMMTLFGIPAAIGLCLLSFIIK